MNKLKPSKQTKEQKGNYPPKYSLNKPELSDMKNFKLIFKDRIDDLKEFARDTIRLIPPVVDADNIIETTSPDSANVFNVKAVVEYGCSLQNNLNFSDRKSQDMIHAIFELAKYLYEPLKPKGYATKSKNEDSIKVFSRFSSTMNQLDKLIEVTEKNEWLPYAVKAELMDAESSLNNAFHHLKMAVNRSKMLTLKIDSCFNQLTDVFGNEIEAGRQIDALIHYLEACGFTLFQGAKDWRYRRKSYLTNKSKKKK